MSDLSMDDVRAERERDLRPDAGPIFNALNEQVIDLHAKWCQYRILFDSDEHLKVLNDAAPYLFAMLQEIMWKDILLGVARLMDPSKSAGKGVRENLTLEALVDALDPSVLRDELCRLLVQARKDAEFAVTWRMKSLAHSDRAYAMGRSATPLPEVNQGKVETALGSVGAVLNEVAKHYWQIRIDFTPTASKDATNLLHFLRIGIKAQNEGFGRPIAD
jgi:hypothetical protein